METYSSAEDLAIKTRKPYTITKQRERWTEEEHNRFLEALKLYGRAWQRIEEHIGTKTAVQIRSHAQKFFSKLEKEALAKGIPVEQATDIEIPPPRPKRKPSNPYPRKTGVVGAPITQAGAKDEKHATPRSLHSCKQLLDLEKEPLLEKSVGDGGTEDTVHKRGCKDCSKFTFSQEPPSTFASSANRSSVMSLNAENSRNFGEFVPLAKHVNTCDTSSGSHMTDGPNRSYQPNEAAVGAIQNNGTENEMRGAKSYPRHAPIHIIDGSAKTSSHHHSSDVSYQESTNPQIGVHPHPALFINPSVSPAAGNPATTPRSGNHQNFPSFHPSNANEEDYSSLLQMSSTFASVLVSTLLQNPAAHAAASYAATFWPGKNMDASSDSRQPPSMAAIAAATMAAATAWWAAHGLLPLCAPAHGFGCPPATTANADPQNNCQLALSIKERDENNSIQKCSSPDQQLRQDLSEAIQAENSGAKSPTMSSSESGDNLDPEVNGVLTSTTHEKNNSAVVEQKDSGKNNRKQVDRSSCGSNSSSEVETDALEKHENSKEENKEADASHAASDSYSRRFRNNINLIDSRKEVSEEGRVAFRALFLREILPQSFSPPNDPKNDDDENILNAERNNDASRFDLNTTEPCPSHNETDNRLTEDIKAGEGLLTLGLAQSNLRTWRTGFKPYKRCSVEARESPTNQDQEKSAKRLRLEDQASA